MQTGLDDYSNLEDSTKELRGHTDSVSTILSSLSSCLKSSLVCGFQQILSGILLVSHAKAAQVACLQFNAEGTLLASGGLDGKQTAWQCSALMLNLNTSELKINGQMIESRLTEVQTFHIYSNVEKFDELLMSKNTVTLH